MLDGMTAYTPPGWPPAVPPPGAPGFADRARGFLLDLCPPDYRGYPVLARHLPLLVRFTARLLAAQLVGTDTATAALRADMAGFVDGRAIEDGLRTLRAEKARLEAAILAVSLIERVLRGEEFVARL